MEQPDEWTCGKGLAASAVLPERLGAVLAAMAEVLQVHREALDPQDEASRPEDEAYHRVSQHLVQIASHLAALAQEMAGYRDVPMGRHDLEVMTRPIVRETFAAFVARKQELLTLLQEMEEEDREMLQQMPE
jgi:hypothetical protein